MAAHGNAELCERDVYAGLEVAKDRKSVGACDVCVHCQKVGGRDVGARPGMCWLKPPRECFECRKCLLRPLRILSVV